MIRSDTPGRCGPAMPGIRARVLRFGRGVVMAAVMAACGASPPTAPDADPLDPNGPPPNGTPVEARFVGVGHQAAGRVRLTIGGGRARIEVQSDFSVDPVPAPYLYLNTTNNPNTGTPIRIARLRANAGAQQYDFTVPNGVRYDWILVWCDQFNTPVAQAPLPAP